MEEERHNTLVTYVLRLRADFRHFDALVCAQARFPSRTLPCFRRDLVGDRLGICSRGRGLVGAEIRTLATAADNGPTTWSAPAGSNERSKSKVRRRWRRSEEADNLPKP